MCFHKWSKWSVSFQDYGGSNFQARKCEDCGKTTVRRIVHFMRAHVQAHQINTALEGVK